MPSGSMPFTIDVLLSNANFLKLYIYIYIYINLTITIVLLYWNRGIKCTWEAIISPNSRNIAQGAVRHFINVILLMNICAKSLKVKIFNLSALVYMNQRTVEIRQYGFPAASIFSVIRMIDHWCVRHCHRDYQCSVVSLGTYKHERK